MRLAFMHTERSFLDAEITAYKSLQELQGKDIPVMLTAGEARQSTAIFAIIMFVEGRGPFRMFWLSLTRMRTRTCVRTRIRLVLPYSLPISGNLQRVKMT